MALGEVSGEITQVRRAAQPELLEIDATTPTSSCGFLLLFGKRERSDFIHVLAQA